MNIKKIFTLILAFLLSMTLLSSCGSEPAEPPSNSSDNQSVNANEKGAVPQKELKLISTAADITEILDGLGCSEKIVLADTYSAGIGMINSEVCTMDYLNPDVEAIAALAPDCVFVSGSSTDGTVDPYAALSDLGIKVIYIPTAESINGIKDNIMSIASEIAAETKADEMNNAIDEAVKSAKRNAEGKEQATVYFEISAAPWLYTFGNGTFLDEIITICGGKNIYSETSGWISNTEESVLEANPQIIITNVMYDGYDYNEIYSRPGWETVDAVKNSKVYSIDANASSRGSQNIVKAIEEISKAICGS